MLTRTLVHAIIALAILQVLAHAASNVSPALTFLLGVLMAGPVPGLPASLGFAIGINNHKSLAVGTYALLLLIAGSLSAAAPIAASFGLSLIGGNACRGILQEPRKALRDEQRTE